MLSLRLLHVRLVERIDAQHAAGDRRGVLPDHELRTERPGDRRASAVCRCWPSVTRWRSGTRPMPGASDRLDDDGQQARAVLAGRLGDQLLGPVAEARMPRPEVGEDDLVAARAAAPPEDGSQASGPGLSSSPAEGGAAIRRRHRAAPPTSTPASALGTRPKADSAL